MSVPAFAPRLAFVDVETTGSSPDRERVTEVGIVAVDFEGDDQRVVEWSTLVNPGIPIPPEIQWLTGITNDMVRSAPTFADVAQEVFDRLEGAVFVAHNARFDYGFLRAEFTRAGFAFSARTLCTVRLSRFLYPDRAPHSLDAIIERFNLTCEDRHRALGDARVLWRWLQKLGERHARSELELAVAALLRRPSLPSHLPPNALEELPHAPGVYLLFGLNEHPIYIGKSIDLRVRVASHFNSEYRASRELRLSQEVHRLEWEETAGEFSALLRESELVKTRMPAHNVALRRQLNQVMLSLDGSGRPIFVKCTAFAPDSDGAFYGPFSSRTSARRLLLDLAAEQSLCLKLMRLERRRGDEPCFARQLLRCHGACVGMESATDHGARVAAAISARRLPRWPWSGPIAAVERNPDRFRETFHVFDRWCWLGAVGSLDAACALAHSAPRVFEAEAARLLLQAVESDRWSLQLFELPATPALSASRAEPAPAEESRPPDSVREIA